MTQPSFTIPKNIWFAALVAIIIFCAGRFLMAHIAYDKKDLAATGFLFDIIITFPVVCYFLVIRPLKLRKSSIVLVFTLCCAAAYFILPAHQQSYILQLRKLTALVELGIITYFIIKARKVRTEYMRLQAIFPDTAYNLYQSMVAIFGNRLYVKMVASELTVLRFGLLCWKKQRPIPAKYHSYTVYKESGYPAVFGMILFACVVEITGLHILLLHYSKTAAIITSILSIYGTIFIVSDISAILKSPVLVTDDTLLLRVGLRWRVGVNKNDIIAIEKIKADFQPGDNCFKGSILKNSANILIQFKHPTIIERLYRKPVVADKIIMNIDHAEDFITRLKNQ